MACELSEVHSAGADWPATATVLLAALGRKAPFQERRTEVARLLSFLGACPAAISNVKRSQRSLQALASLLDKRRADGSTTMLRLSDAAGCPGAKTSDGHGDFVPCRKRACTWRMSAPTAPADAPLFARPPVEGLPTLAGLPFELTAYVVRLIGYDFDVLAALRLTCRALCRAVDMALPSILIDCDLIYRGPTRAWTTYPSFMLDKAAERLAAAKRLAPAPFLRGEPVAPHVGRLVARPGLTIAALRKAGPRADWRRHLAEMHWGGRYRLAYQALMAPFPTDDAPDQVARLLERLQAVEQRYGVSILIGAEDRATVDWRLSLADCLPALEPQYNEALAHLQERHPLLCSQAVLGQRRDLFFRLAIRVPHAEGAVPAVVTNGVMQFCITLMNNEADAVSQMVANEGVPLALLLHHGTLLNSFASTRHHANLDVTIQAYVGDAEQRCRSFIRSYKTENSLTSNAALVWDDMVELGLPADAAQAAAVHMPGRLVVAGFVRHALAARKTTDVYHLRLRALWAEFGPAIVALAHGAI